MLAWAIWCAESCETEHKFRAFEEELREVRALNWGARPWSGATDQDASARHVAQMAEAFTSGSGVYPSRQLQPLRR